MVFYQNRMFHLPVHVGKVDDSALPVRPADEPRMENFTAAGADQYADNRRRYFILPK